MRRIHKQIFMGNGVHSMAECYHLHQLLDKSLTMLSGMQQGGDPENPEYAMMVGQIICALTGKKFSTNEIIKMLKEPRADIHDFEDEDDVEFDDDDLDDDFDFDFDDEDFDEIPSNVVKNLKKRKYEDDDEDDDLDFDFDLSDEDFDDTFFEKPKKKVEEPDPMDISPELDEFVNTFRNLLEDLTKKR